MSTEDVTRAEGQQVDQRETSRQTGRLVAVAVCATHTQQSRVVLGANWVTQQLTTKAQKEDENNTRCWPPTVKVGPKGPTVASGELKLSRGFNTRCFGKQEGRGSYQQ